MTLRTLLRSLALRPGPGLPKSFPAEVHADLFLEDVL